MHTGPMPDSAGTFEGWKEARRHCPKCAKATVRYRVWESSCGGYEDLNFACTACGHSWWVDGCDS
jgi:DNA-directed RNA polymerase subunit M/transcription elongation factor TFIIS